MVSRLRMACWIEKNYEKKTFITPGQNKISFERRRVGLGTTVEYIERKFKTKAWKRHVVKTLEKSGLEPAAPNRLADRKLCALSTQPNPHLLVDGDRKLSIFPRVDPFRIRLCNLPSNPCCVKKSFMEVKKYEKLGEECLWNRIWKFAVVVAVVAVAIVISQ